ncbi:MAG: RnfH family protein [Gammaproteobacteria bacterium]|nr:RnfH family protein [Gammaproteobacteria bacterium]
MASIDVQVVYALPGEQTVVDLQVTAGTSAREAILASGILERYPAIDLARTAIGVYAEVVSLDYELEPGDRVEIYRPLMIEPREQRRRAAARQRGA